MRQKYSLNSISNACPFIFHKDTIYNQKNAFHVSKTVIFTLKVVTIAILQVTKTNKYGEKPEYKHKRMKNKIAILFFLSLFGFAATATAQTFEWDSQKKTQQSKKEGYYTIYVGTFLNAKISDFKNIQHLGYLYSEAYDANLQKIYMGGYTSETTAKRVLAKVKPLGYDDAYIAGKSGDKSQYEVVIQLGREKAGNTINWKRYGAAGDLLALLENDYVKMVTVHIAVKAQLLLTCRACVH